MSAARKRTRALPRPAVSISRRVRAGWAPAARELSAWAAAALGARARGRELSVLLVAKAASRALNARYRGRDQPTNVLSFPAPPSLAAVSGLLGDLVICPALLRLEARAQHKSARAHWTHLVVHGVLHLIGYDHEREHDARRMQRREIRTLRQLGVANPYRTRSARAPASR
jgi:probable rRNA maturation factor